MIFRQPGSYPGIPGLFAGCHVEVDGAGTVKETPLVHHPAEAVAPPAEETTVQEQAAPTPAPYPIGG